MPKSSFDCAIRRILTRSSYNMMFIKLVTLFVVSKADSDTSTPEVHLEITDIHAHALGLYSKIHDRLFQDSTVLNRLVVTAERNKDRDEEAMERYMHWIHQSNELRRKYHPFYEWQFHDLLQQALHASNSTLMEQLVHGLEQWNQYFEI